MKYGGNFLQKPFQISISVSSPTMPIQVVNVSVHKLHATVNHIKTPKKNAVSSVLSHLLRHYFYPLAQVLFPLE